MAYTFLVNDESVNRHGTRILTSGIDLTDFEKNPIMLYCHIRGWTDKEDMILPIGYWENFVVKGSKLYADAVFDKDDEFAQKIENKVKNKVLRTCSPSLEVLTVSDDPAYLVKGQTRATVIKSSLREISIADIPSNRNAIKLYDQSSGTELNLSAQEDNNLIPLIGNKQNKETMNLKDEVAGLLNLSAQTDDNAIITALKGALGGSQDVINLRSENQALKTKVDAYEAKEKEVQQQAIIDLVDSAVKERRIIDKDKEKYLKLAAQDFDTVKTLLSDMVPVVDLSAQETGGSLDLTDPWEERKQEIKNNLKNR